MIGDDEKDDLVIMMSMLAMAMSIMKISRSLPLPPVVNKILYLQREHLEATAAAASSPAAVWERVKKTRRGLEQQDGVVFSG